MKKVLIIILVIVAGLIIWKREPWVKTFASQQECESGVGTSCVRLQCDLVQTTFWLDCPHGSSFWTPRVVPQY